MKKICIYLIDWYQKNISKILESKNIRCKFYPTCSEYTRQAIKKYGVIDIEPLINSLPIIYTALKEYIMKNGHFIFVDIESSDGNKVFIKV